MPDWLRPGAAQLVTAHPAWVDMMPWYVLKLFSFLLRPKPQISVGQSPGTGYVEITITTINSKLLKMHATKQYQSIGLMQRQILSLPRRPSSLSTQSLLHMFEPTKIGRLDLDFSRSELQFMRKCSSR